MRACVGQDLADVAPLRVPASQSYRAQGPFRTSPHGSRVFIADNTGGDRAIVKLWDIRYNTGSASFQRQRVWETAGPEGVVRCMQWDGGRYAVTYAPCEGGAQLSLRPWIDRVCVRVCVHSGDDHGNACVWNTEAGALAHRTLRAHGSPSPIRHLTLPDLPVCVAGIWTGLRVFSPDAPMNTHLVDLAEFNGAEEPGRERGKVWSELQPIPERCDDTWTAAHTACLPAACPDLLRRHVTGPGTTPGSSGRQFCRVERVRPSRAGYEPDMLACGVRGHRCV